MISGSWVLYSTNYFNLEPHYLCWNEGAENNKFTCYADKVLDETKEGPTFCNTDLKFEYNFNLPGTIHGWVEQYNLTCEG
jgi:hypothetical protein